jgi:hypothetical protein
MPYETGAKVKLTRDAQVTADGASSGTGFPGPLFLAEGLKGIVTDVTREAGGVAQDNLALFEQQVRGAQLDGFAAGLVEGLRQRVVQAGGVDTGIGARITYKVRFENGFVLNGLAEDWLTEA